MRGADEQIRSETGDSSPDIELCIHESGAMMLCLYSSFIFCLGKKSEKKNSGSGKRAHWLLCGGLTNDSMRVKVCAKGSSRRLVEQNRARLGGGLRVYRRSGQDDSSLKAAMRRERRWCTEWTNRRRTGENGDGTGESAVEAM